MRLWISTRRRVASARAACTRDIPSGIRVGIKSRSCRRSLRTSPSTAAIGASVRTAARFTLAPLPDEHAPQFGPQLTALIAYLTVVCRMPRLVVQRFLEGALQIPISLGSTQNDWEETSAAVAAPCAELETALRHEAVVNADETGHRTNGEKRWLWAFVARTFVLYRIAASRGSDVLQGVLGATFTGILGSESLARLSEIRRRPTTVLLGSYHSELAQCARPRHHTGRETLLPRSSGSTAACFASGIASAAIRPPGAPGSPVRNSSPKCCRLRALGERYLDAANADVRNLAHAFFVNNQHCFTFMHEEGVEPTYNSAERALRTAVAWGSLCVLSFEARKHWGSCVVGSFPRTSDRMAPSDGRPHSITIKVRAANLPGRIRDLLPGGQHAAVDERADEIRNDD